MEEKRPIDDVEAAEDNSSSPPQYGGTDGVGSQPPTYQQAIGPSKTNTCDYNSEDESIQFNEPPPSYQSLFGEIKEARQSASSVFDFLKKLFVLLIGTIGCTIALGIIMAIPITMIVIGTHYKDQCKIEKYIPIYLIVGGSFGILRNLISLCQRARKGDSEDESESSRNPLGSIIDCFLFAWFIAGNVWIYSNYKPKFDEPSSPQYCNKILYLFAFWLTNVTYIMMGVLCLCVCCAGMCAALL